MAIQKVKLYSNSGSYRNSQADGRLVAQPKRRGTLRPAEGWTVLLLLAIALYSVVVSIISVQWVENSPLLLYMPICGLLVGMVIAKIPRFPQSILHLAACLIGHWLAVWLTSTVGSPKLGKGKKRSWIFCETGLIREAGMRLSGNGAFPLGSRTVVRGASAEKQI